jgi:hypothetical protein
MIEYSQGKDRLVDIPESLPGVPDNALEGPPDEEASTQVGVSDLEGEVSEPDTEGDGRDL